MLSNMARGGDAETRSTNNYQHHASHPHPVYLQPQVRATQEGGTHAARWPMPLSCGMTDLMHVLCRQCHTACSMASKAEIRRMLREKKANASAKGREHYHYSV